MKVSNIIYILIILFSMILSYLVYWKLSIYFAIYAFFIALFFAFLGGLSAIFDLRNN